MNKAILIIILLFAALLFFYESGTVNELRVLNKTSLPPPSFYSNYSVEQAILNRESIREYTDESLSLQEISQLLWSGQGITHNNYRAAPSAGALYPYELYIVDEVGVYHYVPENHSLELIMREDIRKELGVVAYNQEHVSNAGLIIVFAGIYEREMEKYGSRGIIYTHIEAGHIAENILLQAVAMNLGACPVGSFSPDKVRNIMNLPKNHEIIYMITAGNIR